MKLFIGNSLCPLLDANLVLFRELLHVGVSLAILLGHLDNHLLQVVNVELERRQYLLHGLLHQHAVHQAVALAFRLAPFQILRHQTMLLAFLLQVAQLCRHLLQVESHLFELSDNLLLVGLILRHLFLRFLPTL